MAKDGKLYLSKGPRYLSYPEFPDSCRSPICRSTIQRDVVLVVDRLAPYAIALLTQVHEKDTLMQNFCVVKK